MRRSCGWQARRRFVWAVALCSVACGSAQRVDAPTAKPPARVILPTGQAGRPPLLIRGATVWTATGQVLANTDVLARDGRIVAIGTGLPAPADARIIDAGGRVLTPGLVDLHSHLGVYAAPSARAHADGNEMSHPIMPMVRAIDSFDPEDPAIARALGGGVTTALILPGSGNIMGGEGVLVKLRGARVGDMVLEGAPRQLKMAMGENPKRAHTERGRAPMTRMGHVWLMRERFAKARRAMEAADTATRQGKPLPAEALEHESIIDLLRGRARLHVHCYEVHDIEALLRVAVEAGVRVTALHHALEAWKVAPLLREHGIGVATFADLWGFKLEAWDASVRAPAVLHEAGVEVAIKSDHPVLDARDLMFEAAKAHHHGLPAQAALAAVTRVPAQLAGIGDRLGTIEVGKDADLVLWQSPPLDTVLARPSVVVVDGVVWVEGGRNAQDHGAGAPRAAATNPCGCGL